jgi:hypothetical protein
MRRLVAGEGAGKQRMGMDKRLDAILDVPEGNLRDLLHVLGDPEFTHPFRLGGKLTRLGAATDELRFMARYGRKVHDALKDAPRNFFPHLLERLRGLDDAAADDLVRQVMDAGTPVKREAVLGDMPPRPPARRPARHGRADPNDPKWPEYQRKAREFLTDPAENRQAKLRGQVALDDAVEALATVLQVRDRVSLRWEAHQNLPYEQKLRILQDLDDIARQGGLATGWINNARGRVAEALFAPGGGLHQQRIPNPVHDAPSGGPGFTRLDGKYGPKERPGSTSGKAEWVEVKSDLVDMPGRLGEPNAEAVAIARKYAAEGRQDWDGLQASPATSDDRLVIRFAREPDLPTQKAMRDVLFSPDSPFDAVAFGDDWHPRPNDDRPKGRTRAEVTGTGGAPAPEPVLAGAGGGVDPP